MTKIEWTEETWNPIISGCARKDRGCKNCYAIIMAHRLAAMGQKKYEGTTIKRKNGILDWTGKINIVRDDSLTKPLRIKKPSLIFVNSMADLFHEDVPLLVIAEVFAMMFLVDRHRYQLLTKREDRMCEVLNSEAFLQEFHMAINRLHNEHIAPLEQELYFYEEARAYLPLKNVILGVSVNDQPSLQKRAPYLLKTPAAFRFISCEPLTGPLDFTDTNLNGRPYNALSGIGECSIGGPRIDWLITGGESGYGKGIVACHPNWIRSLRDQCKKFGANFFFKQWGAFQPTPWPEETEIPDNALTPFGKEDSLKNRIYFLRVGKKKAGKTLDGKIHLEHPDIWRKAS